jgi:hypothetical protein
MALLIVAHLLAINLDLSWPTATSPPVRNSCSSTNGIPRAAENGQPTIAPKAKKNVARNARFIPLGVDVAGWNQYEHASIVVYIANDEGRNAACVSEDSGRI